MKFRGLVLAAAVLLILGGVLYWSEHRKTPESPASADTPAILKVDPASITSLTLKAKGAQPITLRQAGTGQWHITAPGDYPADASTVSGMLSALAPLTAQRVVDDHATNLAQFGLNDPSVELDLTGKDNKTTRLLLGDDTPTGDAVYAAVAGDPRLFTAAAFIKSSLNKSLNDLRDKRLLPIQADSVSSIDLERKGQAIGFARVRNGWQIEKPKPYRTDTFQVDDLLQQLTSAKWDASVAAADATKSFAHAAPVATVKVTGSAGNDTLEVRKDKSDYYAKSSAVAGTWKVDASNASALGQALEHSLDDFRNKQLFDLGFSDPDKVEYHSGATSLVLTHTGNDWWSNGKKMDADSVEMLVTTLRDLTATKFVDSGFSAPTIEITVTSGGGKKVDKVGIQKTGDAGLARREDDPTLYSLDAATINSLTNAIAGIKPAGPVKKN